MSIAVVIPTFNRKDHLLKLLQNLAQQVGFREKYELIVVVDGSTDGTLEMLSEYFPNVHIVNGDGNWFWTRSLNEGIRFARTIGCEGVMHLNDDLTVPSDYLHRLERSVHRHPKSVIGSLCLTSESPRRVFFAGVQEINWCTTKRKHYFKPFSNYDPDVHRGTRPVCELPGRGMYLPMEVIDEIGPLNEATFPQYKSDSDITLRAVENGVNVIIDYDLILFTEVDLTGDGASFRKEPFLKFLRGFRNKYAHNSIVADWNFYKLHSNCFFLWSFLMSNVKKFVTYARVNVFN